MKNIVSIFAGLFLVTACFGKQPQINEWHQLIFKHSNRALDNTGATNNSSQPHQWEKLAQNHQYIDNQLWKLNDAGSGYFYLINKKSNKILEVGGAKMEDGAAIVQWDITDWNGGNHQKWMLEAESNGFRLKNKHSGKYLDVSNISQSNGAKIHQWNRAGDNQIVIFQKFGTPTGSEIPLNLADALLFAGWRNAQQLAQMSQGDMKNTIIAEMVSHSNQSVPFFQGRSDANLVEDVALVATLIKRGYRTKADLNNLSLDDHRNVLIAAIHSNKGIGVPTLQSWSNRGLVEYEWSYIIVQNYEWEENNTPTITITNPTLGQPPVSVVLYDGDNYSGDFTYLNPGWYGEKIIDRLVGNNKISSVKVPNGWTVTLYDNKDFTGDKMTINTNQSNVGSLANRASSVVITDSQNHNTKAEFYEHANYGGRKLELAPGNYDAEYLKQQGFHDNISSIKSNGLGVKTFLDEGFDGNVADFIDVIYNDFNDHTSSVVVNSARPRDEIVEAGLYVIQSACNGKCLAIDGDKIVTKDCDATDAKQKWQIASGDNYEHLIRPGNAVQAGTITLTSYDPRVLSFNPYRGYFELKDMSEIGLDFLGSFGLTVENNILNTGNLERWAAICDFRKVRYSPYYKMRFRYEWRKTTFTDGNYNKHDAVLSVGGNKAVTNGNHVVHNGDFVTPCEDWKLIKLN